MTIQLDRPFAVPAGVNPSSLVTQEFGNQASFEPLGWKYADGSIWYPGTVNGNWHNGIDYGLSLGTPLRAPADGVVTYAGWDTTGFGNRVSIDHGEVLTLCGHQSKIAVAVGQRVTKGQITGYVGSTGNSSGPHLHWSVQRKADYHFVNPLPYLASPAPAPPPTIPDRWTSHIHAVQAIFNGTPNSPKDRRDAWQRAYDYVKNTGRL